MAAADLAPKPQTLDYIQAAAVPLSALTAWEGLFDHGKLAAEQKVLIHGAAGGVGSFAVQLAHWRGAHVIATASSPNLAFVRDLGAEQVMTEPNGIPPRSRRQEKVSPEREYLKRPSVPS